MAVFSDARVEAMLLGCVITRPDTLPVVRLLVDPEAFTLPFHRDVWGAVCRLDDRRLPPDLTAVAGEMGELAGDAWLALVDLLDVAVREGVSMDGAKRAAERLAELLLLRRLHEAGAKVPAMLADHRGPGQGRAALDAVQAAFAAVRPPTVRQDAVHDDELVAEALVALESGGGPRGRPSGYPTLDDALGGLPRGELVVVAGRPAMGKSAFALGMADARDALVFTLEMGREAFATRRLAMVAGVDLGRLAAGRLSSHERARARDAVEQRRGQGPRVVAARGSTILDLRLQARRLAAEAPVGLVVVDYLQLVRPPPDMPRTASREAQVAQVSAGLLDLAGELGVPVVALSQLSREVERRPDKRPCLSDLRESGAIEQDADTILFPWRPAAYDPGADPAVIEIIVGKRRNGPPGSVRLWWDGPTCSVRDPSDRPGNVASLRLPPAVGSGDWIAAQIELARLDGIVEVDEVGAFLVRAGLDPARLEGDRREAFRRWFAGR
jgi:replicative DNA helicase